MNIFFDLLLALPSRAHLFEIMTKIKKIQPPPTIFHKAPGRLSCESRITVGTRFAKDVKKTRGTLFDNSTPPGRNTRSYLKNADYVQGQGEGRRKSGAYTG